MRLEHVLRTTLRHEATNTDTALDPEVVLDRTRRRHRRRVRGAYSVGVVLLVAAAVVLPALLLGGGHGADRTPQAAPAPAPTSVRSEPPASVSPSRSPVAESSRPGTEAARPTERRSPAPASDPGERSRLSTSSIGSSPPNTRTEPTRSASVLGKPERACGMIVARQQGHSAQIEASGTDCATARRVAARAGGEGRQAYDSTDGFHCTPAASTTSQDTRYSCSRERAAITFRYSE